MKVQFKADGITTHGQGVIFSDSESETIEKVDFPMLIDTNNEVISINGDEFDIDDIKIYLGGNDADTVRFIRGKNLEFPTSKDNAVVLCVLAEHDGAGAENKIAKAIAFRLKLMSFGDKVCGPAAFFPASTLLVELE